MIYLIVILLCHFLFFLPPEIVSRKLLLPFPDLYIYFLAYIIKWNFEIFRTGIRSLKGGKSKQEDSGRDRIFFFFWQGQDCSSSDKGTAALMTVEMDTEEGPQVCKII